MIDLSFFRTPVIAAAFSMVGCSALQTPPERFTSPEAALERLERVVAGGEKKDAAALLGSGGDYLLDSGDPILDKQRASLFSAMFKERHSLEQTKSGQSTVLLGSKRWPFAVPLVQRGDSWVFDAAAGREEVLDRRIGENEFATLDTMRSIYIAQREYSAKDWNGDGILTYATRIISTPGNREGLYWSSADGDTETSPLSHVVAQAAAEGYSVTSTDQPRPLHGYLYSLIQPSVNADEPVDALSKPGRYWLFATPVVWNESGVMTFALNERGWVYEKNLGDDLDASKLSRLNVDDSWTRVE
jgi:hypothetical protein